MSEYAKTRSQEQAETMDWRLELEAWGVNPTEVKYNRAYSGQAIPILETDPKELVEGDFTPMWFTKSNGKWFAPGHGLRKHAIVNKDSKYAEEVLPEIDYITEIVHDAQSTFIVDVVGPTEWGIRQLIMRDLGFIPTNMRNPDQYPDTDPDYVYLPGTKNSDGSVGSGNTWWYRILVQENPSVLDIDYDEFDIQRYYTTRVQEEEARRTQEEPTFEEPGFWDNLAAEGYFEEPEEKYIPPLELMGETQLRILDVLLEKVGSDSPLVPPDQKFEIYTLDERTLRTLHAVASAFNRRSPMFLEGGTAVSKTSVVEYLANKVEAPVSRFNFSGQTNTGDLIGRYVPNNGADREALDARIYGWDSFDDEVSAQVIEKFSDESQGILKRVRSSGDVWDLKI